MISLPQTRPLSSQRWIRLSSSFGSGTTCLKWCPRVWTRQIISTSVVTSRHKPKTLRASEATS